MGRYRHVFRFGNLVHGDKFVLLSEAERNRKQGWSDALFVYEKKKPRKKDADKRIGRATFLSLPGRPLQEFHYNDKVLKLDM